VIATATDNRKSDMAAKTGNNYISENVTDSVEILTANSGFSTMTSSSKVLPSDSDNDGQQDWRPKHLYCYFRLSVVVTIARRQFLRAVIVPEI